MLAQQHLQLQGGCDVGYEMILDTSTNSLALSRLRKEGHVLCPLFSTPARDLNVKNAGRVAE